MSRTSTDKKDASESFPGKEEMELSLQKIDSELKVARQERDKALQELKRLKQHLLEKVHLFQISLICSGYMTY